MPPSLPRRLAEACVAAIAALGLALLAFQIVCRCTAPLGNTDVFWQVRAGELALTAGRVPDTDPFSYTIQGEPWNNHEWAFEILAALLHRAFGWGAFRLLVLAVWGGTALAVAVTAARRAGASMGLLRFGPALLVLSLFEVLAGYKMKPVPQTLSMPLLLAALAFFRGPIMLGSRRRAAALVLYLLVWGNFTAEALTFLPFLFLDQLCLRRGRRPEDPPPDRTTLLLLVLASLAPLVNPPWSSVLDYALRGTAVNRVVNAEFTPLWRAAASVHPITKLAARAVVLGYLPWAGRALYRARDRWATLRSVGPGLFAVVGAVFLERDLWLLVLPAGQVLLDLAPRARLGVAAGAAALGLALYVAYAADLGWSNAVAWASLRDPRYRTTHINDELIPARCVEKLAGSPAGTRLFTLRLWASYALWRLPEVRVFYDGRNLEYGIDIFEAGSQIWMGGPAAGRILDATRTDVVIAKPGWDQQPGLRGGPWRPVLIEPHCVVYERETPQ
jgi:hypothetical protein